MSLIPTPKKPQAQTEDRLILFRVFVNRHLIIGLAAGLFVGFAAGFLFTNTINKRETERLQVESQRAKESDATGASATTAAANNAPPQLTADEVRAAVARAEREPRDIYLQRNVGQMLYLYASQANDKNLLADAIRLLDRAYRADPENFDTLVLLGNATFDLAQATDARRFREARSYYEKALRLRPDDVRVRNDLGLAYYYGEPSEPRRAIEEYEKALRLEPRHEAALQNISQALVSLGEIERARQTLETLRGVNPGNPALSDLQARIVGRQNATDLPGERQ